jgi:DNA polymerase-3 subunit alpha
MLNKLKNFYISERLCKVDEDFLSYEEDFISKEDLDTIISLLQDEKKLKMNNIHNSIILYITGLSDEFNFEKARCDTISGSPPDIDIDFDALDRDKAIDWVVEKWGRDNVANIITHGTFKPKSLARGYYRVTEKDSQDLNALLKKIPPPKFGKESTMEEILTLNPDIQKNPTYTDFLEFSTKLENMVSTFGIHAAGIVISDFPIHDVVPMWKNSKAERITQFDKDEVEELGLSIIKECVRLIKKHKKEEIDVFGIEDFDSKAYNLMNSGLLTGIFQMETSGKAKQLIQEIEPQSINDLSDISALNRPGPMQAGLDQQYIDTKNQGYIDEQMPEVVQDILKDSQFTLIYQEQIMALLNKMAGFTLKEADDARRAMGKKKKEVLEAYYEKFIEGSKANNIDESYADALWQDIMGFADYCLHGLTKVYTKEYGYIEIKKIVNEQLKVTVLSLDSENKIIEQQVQQYWFKGLKTCYSYTQGDTIILSTNNHKFLTSEGMLEIDSICTQNKKLLKVK